MAQRSLKNPDDGCISLVLGRKRDYHNPQPPPQPFHLKSVRTVSDLIFRDYPKKSFQTKALYGKDVGASYHAHRTLGKNEPLVKESATELASQVGNQTRCRWDRNASSFTRDCIEGARQARDPRLTETRAQYFAKKTADFGSHVPLGGGLRHSDDVVALGFGIIGAQPEFVATSNSHFKNPGTTPRQHLRKETFASQWHEHCGPALSLSTTTNATGLAAAGATRGVPARLNPMRNSSNVGLDYVTAEAAEPQLSATHRAHYSQPFGKAAYIVKHNTRSNMKHVGNASSDPLKEALEHLPEDGHRAFPEPSDTKQNAVNISRPMARNSPAAKGGGVDVHFPTDEVTGAWSNNDYVPPNVGRQRPGAKPGTTHPLPGFGSHYKNMVTATEYNGEFNKKHTPQFIPPDTGRRQHSNVRLRDDAYTEPDFGPSMYGTVHVKQSDKPAVPNRLGWGKTNSQFGMRDLGENAVAGEEFYTSYGGGGYRMFSVENMHQRRHVGPPPFSGSSTMSPLPSSASSASERALMFDDGMSGYPRAQRQTRGKYADAKRVVKDEGASGMLATDATRLAMERTHAKGVVPDALGNIGTELL